MDFNEILSSFYSFSPCFFWANFFDCETRAESVCRHASRAVALFTGGFWSKARFQNQPDSQ